MLSLTEIRHRLPAPLVKRLQSFYSPLIVDKILRGFGEKRDVSVRLNTLKSNRQEFEQYLRATKISWSNISGLNNFYLIKNKSEHYFAKDPWFIQGKIYLQGVSSSLPILCLQPQPGEIILDVAAAPGSKTTQIGISINNTGSIIANEIDPIRYERLKFNLARQGITCAKIRLGDGRDLGTKYPAYFDRVLLDAPCSAEGRINLETARSYLGWSEKKIMGHAKLQKELMTAAWQSLKPDGVMVYSTCTLSPEENEDNIGWFLNTYKDSKLLPLSLPLFTQLPLVTNDVRLSPAYFLKAAPTSLHEGFFICLLQKNKH